MIASNAVPGFMPSANGFRFANRFEPGPTVRFGPLDPRLIGIGDAAGGLCGGMAWFVRERFEAGLAIPPDDVAPANGSTLFRTIVRRQVRSLDWLATPIRFWWMGAFGAGPAGRRTRDREWPRVRAAVDGGRLSRLGLVRHHGLNPLAMKADHQVLAYGYDVDDDAITIRCYDPNWPGRDDVTLTIDADGIRQSTGEALIGWFRID